MAITAGAVIVEVSLDTKKAMAQLESFKTRMKEGMEGVGLAIDSAGFKAVLLGNHLKASASTAAEAHRQLNGAMMATRGALNGINGAAKRAATTNARAFSPRPVRAFNNTLKGTKAGLGSVHGRLLMLSAAVTMVFKKAITTGVVFENEMRKVKAVVGATNDELKALTATARMLGRTTTFMASEVAKAMKVLGQAGFSTTQIQNSISSVLDLSRAASITLERSAQVMISVGKTFGVEAKNISQVGDILIKVANNSATNVDLLGASFSFVGSTAVSTGQKLKEVAAMLGILANRGLRGTKAGTALNEALLRLSQTDMIEKMEAMGVAVKDATGKMRPLAQIFLDLEAQMAGMDDVDKAGKFIAMFGRRGARAGLLIARAGEEVNAFNESMKDIQGEAKKTAKDMEKDLLSKFRLVASAAEELAIVFKNALRPSLIEAAKGIKSMLDELGALIQRFPGVGKAIAGVAVVLGALAAALVTVKFIIAPLITLFTAFAGGVASTSKAVWGLLTALRGLTAFRIHQWVFGLKMRFWALRASIQGVTRAMVMAKALLAAGLLLYGALLVALGFLIKAYWDMQAAQNASNQSQVAANKAAKDFLKIKKATRKEVEAALKSDVAGLKGQGKSDADIMKQLKQWIIDNAKRKAAALNQIKNAVKEQDARVAEKVLDQAILEEKVLKAMIKKGIADIKASSNEDLLDKGAMRLLEINRRERQLASLEKIEKKHAEKIAEIKARIAEQADQKLFRQKVKNNIKLAREEAIVGRANAILALDAAQKRAEAEKKAMQSPGAMDADKDRLAELKKKRAELQGKVDEASMSARSMLNTQIAKQTELINEGGTAQQKYLATLKEIVRSTEALGKQQARVDLVKGTRDARREASLQKEETITGRIARLQDRMAKSQATFRASFSGVKETIAQSGRGGALAERLGNTDPSIALGKKAIKVQEEQLAVQRKQLAVAEKSLEKQESTTATFAD